MSLFDSSGLDDVIHGKLRLGLMACLSGLDSATFGELKAHTLATDGNLSAQLRKLEDAGYVAIEKRFVGRRPQTRARLTESGRAAWSAYLEHLDALIGRSNPAPQD